MSARRRDSDLRQTDRGGIDSRNGAAWLVPVFSGQAWGTVLPDLKTTSLHQFHIDHGAKMVPFAGYDMPVQYAAGVMQEHLHTRAHAGLFDVSHMGQVILRGDDAALQLERLAPIDVAGLKQGRQRYGLFTNEAGGILDDFMVANRGDHLFLVVNAACKDADIAHMKAHLECDVEVIEDRSLLALQGPDAEDVLSAIVPAARDMTFMDVIIADSDYGALWISRSGYSGEDGYEISVADNQAVALAERLVADERVMPIGLGARDSLRLEAGLCLYGNDIDETTTPLEANLKWAMQKARRKGGDREGGFPGAERVLGEFETGVSRLRVGLLPQGRAPMRAHTVLYAAEEGGDPIGEVTSGAFGPSLGAPVSMGYVNCENADTGTRLFGEVRGKRLPVDVVDLPFHPTNYKR